MGSKKKQQQGINQIHNSTMYQYHTPQCTSPVSHNSQFCNRNVHMRAHFCYKIVHCGDMGLVHCGIYEMDLYKWELPIIYYRLIYGGTNAYKMYILVSAVVQLGNTEITAWVSVTAF